MIEAAQIIPPLLRADLILAGMCGDLEQIDAIHKRARQNHPELFRKDDDSEHLGGPKDAHRQHKENHGRD